MFPPQQPLQDPELGCLPIMRQLRYRMEAGGRRQYVLVEHFA